MNAMYLRLKELYREGKLDEKGLETAVARGWITEEQRLEILAEAKEA